MENSKQFKRYFCWYYNETENCWYAKNVHTKIPNAKMQRIMNMEFTDAVRELVSFVEIKSEKRALLDLQQKLQVIDKEYSNQIQENKNLLNAIRSFSKVKNVTKELLAKTK